MMFGNKFVNESAKIDLSLSTPIQVYNWMNRNLRYKQFSKLMSAQEVYEKKYGSCHDFVQFEDYFFKKFDFKYGKVFAIEYTSGKKSGGRTHSFIWFIKKDKYYWFEYAWPSHKGINGPYDSLNELKNDFKDKMLKESNFEDVEFSAVKGIKVGMTLDEYVKACLK